MDFKNILKTEYLDIIFDRRNKEFGAYELRKNYSKRMRNAAVIAVVSALLIGSYPLIAGLIKNNTKTVKPMTKVTKLKAPPPVDKTKPPPPPPPPPPVKPQVKFTPPKIVEKEEVREEEKPPPKKELEKAQASTITVKGDANADLSAPIIPDKGKAVVEEQKPKGPPPIFQAVEQQAEFPGGEDAMLAWLAKNIEYPRIARETGVEGVVYVEFVVNQDGSIEQTKIVRDIGGGCGNAAIAAVKKMPKWKPARNNGQAVRVYFTLPVSFEATN